MERDDASSASPSGDGRPLGAGLDRCSSGVTVFVARGQLLYAERSFFGVSKVTREPDGQYHVLMHGTTNHGRQDTAP